MTQEILDRMYAVGARVIECLHCKKQRHAPRVPAALHGWKRRPDGFWACPECQKR